MNLNVNGINIAFEDVGQGPAILLIHGFPLNRQMWQPQLTPLAEAGHRVIAPDLRGFGQSDAPADGYSIDSFSDDLIALLNALRVDQAVVAGMSMGGYILLNMLERYPQRVKAAVFVATKSAADDEVGRARRSAMAAEAESLGANPLIKIFAELLFAPDTIQSKPQLVAKVTSWMRATNPRALAGGLLAMRDRKDYTPLLREVRQPALVLAGADDRAASPDAVQVFTAKLPRCESRIIKQAGHMLNLEQPEEFNAELLRFLKSLPEQ